jgi:prepilin-type N-terminal cleavage/methylation domain-containing protein
MRRTGARQAGFTIVELMIVVAIIGISRLAVLLAAIPEQHSSGRASVPERPRVARSRASRG